MSQTQYEWMCQCTNCLEVVPTRGALQGADELGVVWLHCRKCQDEAREKGNANARKKRAIP